MVKRSVSKALRSALTLGAFSIVTSTQAQLLTENFGTAASCGTITQGSSSMSLGSGTWTLIYPSTNNSADTMNRWFVSSREAHTGLGNCGNGCQSNSALNNNTLHISTKNAFDPGAVYNDDSVALGLMYTPVMNFFTSNTDMAVEFDYLQGGDGNDLLELIVDIGTPDANPVYTHTLPKTNTGSCSSDGQWVHYKYFFPSALNTITQVYLGFRWRNNADGTGTLPSCAIDNIVVDNTLPLTFIQPNEDALCDGGTFVFSDSALGNVTQWQWSFGSSASPTTNTNTTGNPVNVTFSGPGTYTVSLTVTNGNGTYNTTYDVEVITCTPPVATFSSSSQSLCQGQTISYTDLSIPGSFGIGAWSWQFQGGTPPVSTDQHPTGITYLVPGLYNVTLTVTDTISGLSHDTVYVGYIDVGTCAVPVAAFEQDTTRICQNDCIEFYDISTGIPDSLLWEFEGGNPVLVKNVRDSVDTITVCYTTPGLYNVKLTVWNGAGVDDSLMIDYIKVDTCPIPEPAFTVSSATICPGEAVVFQDLSLYATEWNWQFPGGIPSFSTDQNPVNIQYNTPGIYPVILTAINVNGDSTLVIEGFITVDSCLPPDPRFTVERDSICRGTCVQFFNTSLRADTIFWVFWTHPNPDSIDTVYIKSIVDGILTWDTLRTDSNYYPTYIRADSTIDTIFYDPAPLLCFDDSIVLGVQLFAYNKYDVSILNSQDLPVLNVGGDHPKLQPGPDKYVRIDNINSRFYLEDTVKFETVGTAPYFRWIPEDGLSCYDCMQPIIYPTETRKYYMVNYDDYNCQVMDSVTVFVEEAYYAGIPNIFSPNGDNNNDILWVRGNAISDNGFLMRIYNRYGELVFESYSQNQGWDGTYKGLEAPIGSYKYYIQVTFLNGVQEEMTGNVTLVRY